MAIGLSEEHEALRESVTGWAERNIPSGVVRAAIAAENEERPVFWAGLADQGLLGLHVPEEYGGSGYGLLETAVAVEALGERGRPRPLRPDRARQRRDPRLGRQGPRRTASRPRRRHADRRGRAGRFDHGHPGRGRRPDHQRRRRAGAGRRPRRRPRAPGEHRRGEEWVVVDASRGDRDAGQVAGPHPAVWPQVEAGRRWPYRPGGSWTGWRAPAVLDLAAILLGAEAAGVAVVVRERRVRVRQGARAVRPADRAVPGRQAQVRPDARRAGAGPRGRVGRDPRRGGKGGSEAKEHGRRAGLRRRDRGRGRPRRRRAVRQGRHPDLRRHRLHLRARRPPLLPPRPDPARAARLRRRVGRVGGRAGAGRREPGDGDRARRTTPPPLREGIRTEIAEIAASWRARTSKRALARAGYVMPHLPKPWGRDARPLEQVLIIQELQGRPGQAAADDHRRLGGAVARRVRHARAAGTFPAGRRCAAR